MKQIVAITELKPRTDAIRWTLAEVAISAGRPRSAAYQAVEHQNPKTKTHEALSDALVAEEIRLRDYLLSLHPVASEDTIPQPAGA